MSDDFTFTAGGLTLCRKTIFKWCREDESGRLIPVKGGTCTCGAARLPAYSELDSRYHEPECLQWEKVAKPFPPLTLVTPYNPEQEDK